MRVLIRASILLSLFLAGAARAQTSAVLTFTHPSLGQHVWKEFDPAVGDSVTRVECQGTDSIHALQKTYLWRFVPELHQFARVDSASALGLEGQSGSYTVTESGNYYVTSRNNVGESCAPDHPLSVQLDSTVTYVPIPEGPGAPIEIRIFNVHGQLVPPGKRRASGVYFFEARWRSGLVTRGKLPVLLR